MLCDVSEYSVFSVLLLFGGPLCHGCYKGYCRHCIMCLYGRPAYEEWQPSNSEQDPYTLNKLNTSNSRGGFIDIEMLCFLYILSRNSDSYLWGTLPTGKFHNLAHSYLKLLLIKCYECEPMLQVLQMLGIVVNVWC